MAVTNKRAHVDFELLERYESGVTLLGSEVKAIREGKANLNQAFVRVSNGELILVNASITPTHPPQNYQPTRTRKLLLHRKQIDGLIGKIKGQNLTLIPLKLYNKGNLIKLEIALARSKKKFQKKERVKQRDIERDIQRALKDYERS
jgi:SsrA-binding protein